VIFVFFEFKKDAESHQKLGTDFQPVMFDMDPFGGKKVVPSAKTQVFSSAVFSNTCNTSLEF